MVFELLHHAFGAHTQKLDGNNAECGPMANDCSDAKSLHGPVARSVSDTKYYKGFLSSPQHQAHEAAKKAAQISANHIDRHFDGRDYTGISAKTQIAGAKAAASHPLVNMAQVAGQNASHTVFSHNVYEHSDASYSTANASKDPLPVGVSGASAHHIWADKTGFTGAERTSVAMGQMPSHASSNMTSSGTLASTDWSDTRFSGETDGYPSLNMKKLNEGNKAMYLLMKGSAQTGDGSSEWAMDVNQSGPWKQKGFQYDYGGICPGKFCHYAPDPATQWQNPTYGSR